MAFKIYTKTGDKGETSLFGGKRLPKNHIRIEAYGTIDELNAYIGLVRDAIEDEASRSILKQAQDRLFTIGALLATDPDKPMPLPDIKEIDLELLENEMDRIEEVLEPLKNFILPGGHIIVSYCHVARCVCRRAERNVVALKQESPVADIIPQYINRLSDYLFMLARYQSKLLKVEEVIWLPRK